MEKTKLGKFIDNFVIYFLLLLLSILLFKSIIRNMVLVISLSILTSFLIFKIILHFQNINSLKISLKNKERKDIFNYNIALRKLSENAQLTFFKNMLNEKNIKETKFGLIIDNNILLTNFLKLDLINPETIFDIYSKAKNIKNNEIDEICIICNKVSEDIKPILHFFDIKFTFFSPKETYLMMKNFSCFPKVSEEKIKKKINIFKESFVKSKGKSFIKFSLILFLFSLFTPFTRYYFICASILFLFGTICLSFGKPTQIIMPLSKQFLTK